MAQAPDSPQEDRVLRLGQLALERGFLRPEQLKDALAEQARGVAAGRKQPRPLQNILLEKKYLTNEQLVSLLEEVKHSSQPTLREKVAGPSHEPLGKYEIVRELGRGGMGVVYEALDSTLGRRVALKMMLTNPNADPKEAKMDEERFLREARLCANLPKHPNIVSVHEVGVIEGKRYLAMEFVEGAPMVEWRKIGSISIRQQVALIRDVLLALHHAHELGLIHRDIKPENILIDKKGRVRIADFGLAKLSGQAEGAATLTRTDVAMGTPAYMAPEQMESTKTVDHRADIYSMGVVFYEMLTGGLPVGRFDPPSKMVQVDVRLDEVVLKTLEKMPERRYQRASEVKDDPERSPEARCWHSSFNAMKLKGKTLRIEFVGGRLEMAVS